MIFFSFFTKEAKEMIYLYYNSRKKGKKEFVIEMARKVSPVFGQYYRRSKPRT